MREAILKPGTIKRRISNVYGTGIGAGIGEGDVRSIVFDDDALDLGKWLKERDIIPVSIVMSDGSVIESQPLDTWQGKMSVVSSNAPYCPKLFVAELFPLNTEVFMWDGTPYTLDATQLKAIYDNQALMLGYDIKPTLRYGHEGEVVGMVHDIYDDGTTLFGVVSVSDKKALNDIESGTANKVSIGISMDEQILQDGTVVKPPFIEHVALTAVPQISIQKPLALLMEKARTLTKKLFSKEGVQMAWTPEEEQRIAALETAVKDIQTKLDEMSSGMEAEKKETEAVKADVQASREAAITGKVDALIFAGKVAPASKESLIKTLTGLSRENAESILASYSAAPGMNPKGTMLSKGHGSEPTDDDLKAFYSEHKSELAGLSFEAFKNNKDKFMEVINHVG